MPLCVSPLALPHSSTPNDDFGKIPTNDDRDPPEHQRRGPRGRFDPSAPLIYVLRNKLGLTGAKLGCGLEQCGSCSVLVDGVAQLCCVAPVSYFEGAEIVIVEGLTERDEPGPVQRAFIDAGTAQCGYPSRHRVSHAYTIP